MQLAGEPWNGPGSQSPITTGTTGTTGMAEQSFSTFVQGWELHVAPLEGRLVPVGYQIAWRGGGGGGRWLT